MIKPKYDTIYLSPHLDDVALSCGGQVYTQAAQGRPVLIVTVMAGDPPLQGKSDFAQVLEDRWQLDLDVVARRRLEDEKACRILGADHLYWDVPDCIYRAHEETAEFLYNSNEDLFGPVHPAETALVNAISNWIGQLPPHDHLVAPLGVGNHVDHQLTRQAAERAVAKKLHYYEEYPYVELPGALQAAAPTESNDWQATLIPLSDDALDAKIEAVAAFESQVSTFFRDRSAMGEAIRSYSQSVGGERIWRRTETR